MIELTVPGFGVGPTGQKKVLRLQHLVLDVIGTITLDGRFVDAYYRPIQDLKDRLEIHLLTNDVFRGQPRIDRRLGLTARVFPRASEAAEKAAFVQQFPAGSVAAIGQGAADAGMLAAADIGVCVLSPEGTAKEALLAADLVVPDMGAALDLFLYPLRLVNTLQR